MRPSRGEPYEEGVGPSTFATASLTGCLSCIVATIRTCCCLPSRSGYAPSATSEQSLLGTRQAQQHQQPVEAELESSPLVPPPILTARADRPLLPKGQSRSDDRALQLLREGSSASGLGGAPDSKKDLKGTSKSASSEWKLRKNSFFSVCHIQSPVFFYYSMDYLYIYPRVFLHNC